jgi:exodeoxyribonuclease VII large subunit
LLLKPFTLYQLNEYIKRVIALNFEEAVWISCEISSIKSSRGNHYLDLCQKDERTEDIIANASAAIWYRDYMFIKRKLGKLADSVLTDGTEVKLKVNVEFTEKYGLKLIVKDIDPSYTIGQNELTRQKIYEQLKREQLVELNSLVTMPVVLQKIAVISSESAAGYQDFNKHLINNNFDLDFQVDLYQAAVQGIRVEKEICGALETINKKSDYDCVCIIRGGGSKLDLAWFDNYQIAKTISNMAIPVIVGIGHDIDQTITDIVAHTSVKTPTAAATFILDHNLNFEQHLLTMLDHIKAISRDSFGKHKQFIDQFTNRIELLTGHILKYQASLIDDLALKINREKDYLLKHQNNELDNVLKIINASDPKHILAKGFALIRQEEKIITKLADFNEVENFEIEFNDGKSIIKK